MTKSNLNPSRLLGAAYIRYSSSMQDDSFSLEAQLRQINARAASEGVEIVKVYSDPATSAYKNKYRPGIAQMLEDSHKGQFDTVYVHKVDRLARRLEWSIEIVKQLQKDDVTLKAVEQNFDLSTPEGKLMFHLLGSLGEFYSDNLSKETHKGKLERARQGYHNGWVPWGYRSEKVGEHKLAIQKEELVPAVQQMFERYASGLYYDQDVADWLNEQGFHTMFGKLFTKDAVRDMLKNRFYKGYITYCGTYARNGKTRRKKDGETIKGLHAPIISEELFDKCQKIRAERRRQINSNQTTRKVYLLAGLLTCKECGRRMRAQSANSGRYYRESSRFVGTVCQYSGKSVRAEAVEEQVSKLMESLVLPENWQAALQEILRTKKDEIDPQKEKARIKNEMRRMREAFKRGLYENDEHNFWREIEGLQVQLEALEQLTPHEVRQAGMVLANLQQAWRAATMDEKQELCQIILKQVEYDFGTGKVARVSPKAEYEVLFRLMDGSTEK
ncbi:MAG: recombinase family protein [Chloroflexi bacterium]|nr:recombinase family protein [Chloroflexota bacterium]